MLVCTAQNIAPTGGQIEGEIHTPSGLPVARATVRLLPPGAGNFPASSVATALSSDDGRFVLPNIPNGDGYTLVIMCPGYLYAVYSATGIVGLPTPLAIHGETDHLKVRIVLIPEGVISWRVVDQNGDPVMAVQVLAMSRAGVSSLASGVLSSMTNVRGEFQFANLGAGDYFLRSESDQGVFNGPGYLPMPEFISRQACERPNIFPKRWMTGAQLLFTLPLAWNFPTTR